MKRIAIEEAFVTQAIADEWAKVLANGAPNEPGFRKMGETILADSPGTRLIHERLTNLGAGRIESRVHRDRSGTLSRAADGGRV